MEINEVWKDIIDFPNYQISNLGRVKSKERITKIGIKNVNYRLRKEFMIKIFTNKKGYEQVTIYNLYKKPKTMRVHKLVALSFIPNINNLSQINHIDGNKKNNHYNNLEWCSILENNRYAINNGLINLDLRINNMRKVGQRSHPNKRQKVFQYNKQGTFIKEWISQREASIKLCISETAISNCVKGNSKSAGGYIWKN